MNATRSLANSAEGAVGDGGLRVRRLSSKDISRDIDMFLWSFKLQDIRRWIGQPYWDHETAAAEFADKLEGLPAP
jgi:hypothetical protein